jgi:hypothetical protein
MSMQLLVRSIITHNTRKSFAKVFKVNGGDPGLVNLDVGNAVWREYIPAALATGNFQVKPEPFIITGGLEKVQDGIDILAKGVSAKKVVVEISKD